MTTGPRKSGEFCWINMLTPQPDEACAFFSKLLGWTYAEIPGLGHSVKVGGYDIGGLFDLNGPNTPPGTRAHIGVMVKVDSADAIGAKVTSLGGAARPAFDIMESGRMAVCTDPTGAAFDLWEPKKMAGTEVDSSRHGAPSWFETLTTDVDRATTFYTRLFGWNPEQSTPMPGITYTTFKLGDNFVAGMMQITPEMRTMTSQWATYFTVNDVDAAAREATSVGGKICLRAHDIPEVGCICGITSPQGVMFYVIQYLR